MKRNSALTNKLFKPMKKLFVIGFILMLVSLINGPPVMAFNDVADNPIEVVTTDMDQIAAMNFLLETEVSYVLVLKYPEQEIHADIKATTEKVLISQRPIEPLLYGLGQMLTTTKDNNNHEPDKQINPAGTTIIEGLTRLDIGEHYKC